MRPITFNSILAKPISHLIELRQITGSDYASQVRLLFYFDRYLLERGFFKEPLTRSVIEDYEKTLSHLAPRSRSNRLCVVKQLCEYLSLNEPLTYRPELPRVPTSRDAFIPYIYSQRYREATPPVKRCLGMSLGAGEQNHTLPTHRYCLTCASVAYITLP